MLHTTILKGRWVMVTMMRMRCFVIITAIATALCLLGAGCGSKGTAKTETLNSTMKNNDNGTDQNREKESTEEDSNRKLEKVTMGLAVDTLSLTPLFVAIANGYFEDEGVDLEII